MNEWDNNYNNNSSGSDNTPPEENYENKNTAENQSDASQEKEVVIENPYEKKEKRFTSGSSYNSYQNGYSNAGYQGYNNQTYGSPAPPVPDEPEKKSKGPKVAVALVIILSIVAVVAMILGVIGIQNKEEGQSDNSNSNSPTLSLEESQGEGEISEDGISSVSVAEDVRQSVVGVTVYLNNQVVSEGSGIIMDSNDTKYTYIITCAHVINMENSAIEVQLLDETTYRATIVGYSTRDDIGVLKIEAQGLHAAKFADSDDLKVGERVYAVGNPGGAEFFGSFTGGFVSAIDRTISTNSIGYTMQCIQHDAAINPGNSGGALVNSNGYVVGINSSKIASEEYEGMAFAIPITSAKKVIDSIIANGYVPNQPKLGITYSAASQNQTYSMIVQLQKLPAGTIIVREIQDDSSLVNTDLQVGDMITAVNGKEMTSSNVLADVIESGKVGDKITLSVCRVDRNFDIKEFTVEATLVEDKSDANAVQTSNQDQ